MAVKLEVAFTNAAVWQQMRPKVDDLGEGPELLELSSDQEPCLRQTLVSQIPNASQEIPYWIDCGCYLQMPRHQQHNNQNRESILMHLQASLPAGKCMRFCCNNVQAGSSLTFEKCLLACIPGSNSLLNVQEPQLWKIDFHLYAASRICSIPWAWTNTAMNAVRS